MNPTPNPNPHDSCHHVDTSEGDTFGGLGTSREFREEEIPRIRAQLSPRPTDPPRTRILPGGPLT